MSPKMSQLSKARRLGLLSRHRGLLQRVAERCRVDPSLVSRVFHGKATSARVQKELARALTKLEPQPTPVPRAVPPAVRFTEPLDCSREIRWLAQHRTEYAGQWVALDGDRLIASAATAKEVFEAARQAGVADPLVHLMEPPDALPWGGW